MTARIRRRPSLSEQRTGYAVLAALACLAVWLLFEQAQFNQAVVVAMRGPLIPLRSPSATAGFQAATAALLPDVPGFSALGLIESYNPETLSDKIDGKAELYLPAGFKEMSCRSFGVDNAAGAHVEVFVYDMDAPQNAFAVFSGQRRPGSASLSLTPNAYATTNAIFFTQGKYYVELVADRATDATLAESLTTYAKAVLAALPAGDASSLDPSARFPRQGLAQDSVRLSAADAFGLEGFSNVLTADYSLASGEATAFVAKRATPDEAKADEARYVSFLKANGYTESDPGDLPSGTRLFSLDTSFEAVMLLGDTLAGVHDASSRQAARELCLNLAQTIAGKQ